MSLRIINHNVAGQKSHGPSKGTIIRSAIIKTELIENGLDLEGDDDDNEINTSFVCF